MRAWVGGFTVHTHARTLQEVGNRLLLDAGGFLPAQTGSRLRELRANAEGFKGGDRFYLFLRGKLGDAAHCKSGFQQLLHTHIKRKRLRFNCCPTPDCCSTRRLTRHTPITRVTPMSPNLSMFLHFLPRSPGQQVIRDRVHVIRCYGTGIRSHPPQLRPGTAVQMGKRRQRRRVITVSDLSWHPIYW